MTVRLESPVALGDILVSALVSNTIKADGSHGHVWAFAERRALGFLILQDDRVTAIDANGHPMSASEVETICPGAIAKLKQTAVR